MYTYIVYDRPFAILKHPAIARDRLIAEPLCRTSVIISQFGCIIAAGVAGVGYVTQALIGHKAVGAFVYAGHRVQHPRLVELW